MRWVLVEIRPPDPKLLLVRVDPLPQDVAARASFRARLALHVDEIGRKPMPVATAAASAMVRAIGCCLVAACELLSVIITECAGDAGHEAGSLHHAQRIMQLPFEVPIHASDHVVLQRHPGFLRSLWILP